MRRRLLNTIESPPAGCELLEARLVDDSDLGPHALVAVAAELVAGHVTLARFREARVNGRDVARDQHRIDRRPVDQEAMHHVRARHPEPDRRVRRDQQALWGEGVLLADGAYQNRTVRAQLAAE